MCFERHKDGLVRLGMGRPSSFDGVVCRDEEVGKAGNEEGSKKGVKPRHALGSGGWETQPFLI